MRLRGGTDWVSLPGFLHRNPYCRGVTIVSRAPAVAETLEPLIAATQCAQDRAFMDAATLVGMIEAARAHHRAVCARESADAVRSGEA